MATIVKKGNRYQVQIRRTGEKPIYKSFAERKTALAWARKTESEIDQNVFRDSTLARNTILKKLLHRYELEILPTKRSQAAVRGQIRTISRLIGNLPLTAVTPAELSQYRDHRLRQVANQTARHELSLLQRVFNIAIKDWGIHLPHGNPVEQVRLPPIPQGRNRRPTPNELEVLIADKIIGHYVILAIETGLRRSEITNIALEHYEAERHILRIPITKNGQSRAVPLTERAREVLPAIIERSLRPDSITQAFDRACKKHGFRDLRFHDLRHEATSRFFEKGLNPVEVASITGHKDTRMLMRYTHLSTDHLLERLG